MQRNINRGGAGGLFGVQQQPQHQQTAINKIAMWQERAPQCSCQREVVVYHCQEKKCPNNSKQKVYCQMCLTEGLHSHFPLVMIYDVLSDEERNWTTFNEKLNKILLAANPLYQQLQPLILYFESAAQPNFGKISKDNKNLNDLRQEVTRFQQTVETHVNQGRLIELMQCRGQLREYEKTLTEISYLEKLSEITIFEYYEDGISADHDNKPFQNFTQDHRDLYMRLKLKAINKKVEENYTLLRKQREEIKQQQPQIQVDQFVNKREFREIEKKIQDFKQNLDKQTADLVHTSLRVVQLEQLNVAPKKAGGDFNSDKLLESFRDLSKRFDQSEIYTAQMIGSLDQKILDFKDQLFQREEFQNNEGDQDKFFEHEVRLDSLSQNIQRLRDQCDDMNKIDISQIRQETEEIVQHNIQAVRQEFQVILTHNENKMKQEMEERKERPVFKNQEQMLMSISKKVVDQQQEQQEPLQMSQSQIQKQVDPRTLDKQLKSSKIIRNFNALSFLDSNIKGFKAGETPLYLIYRGTQHGWMFKDFHQKCDDVQTPTFVLFKTTQGTVFGGFTTVGWATSTLTSQSGYKKDQRALLFSVDNQITFNCLKPWKAVYHAASSGPCFGDENLATNIQPMNMENAIECKSLSGSKDVYDIPVSQDGVSLLTGVQGSRFSIEEIEVYMVVV